MSKIKIACTSTGCIEYAPERYHGLGIDIIRIHVLFEGKEYKEGLDLDPVAFYNRLETIEDPMMKKVRQLDKLIDELAKGKPLEKIKR